MALQRARGDPLAGLSILLGAERRIIRGGRCGKERPAEEGGGGPQGRRQGGNPSLSSIADVIEIAGFSRGVINSGSQSVRSGSKRSVLADRIVGDKQVTPRFIADGLACWHQSVAAFALSRTISSVISLDTLRLARYRAVSVSTTKSGSISLFLIVVDPRTIVFWWLQPFQRRKSRLQG